MFRRRKTIFALIGLAIVGFVVIQFIPVGNIISGLKFPGNPPVNQQFQWDSPQTEQLAKAACYDCHSNETKYPWYANVAPVSWLLYHDINEARDNLNFSTWSKQEIDVDKIINQIERGEMPKAIYLPLHPEANLTAEQKTQLIAGLRETFGG